MTANTIIDPAEFLSEHIERAEPDLLRSILKTFVEALMGAELGLPCGSHLSDLGCLALLERRRDCGIASTQAARVRPARVNGLATIEPERRRRRQLRNTLPVASDVRAERHVDRGAQAG